MSEVPSPIEVTNWPQVAALALLLTAFVILPAVINYLMNRPVKRTLTTNNGGSTMKDVIERIDKRLATIEAAAPTTPTAEDFDDAPNP
jgi:hypothetical protein